MNKNFMKMFAGAAAFSLTLLAGTAQAGEVSAAVAANFTGTMKEIAASFEQATGNTVKLSFGSTGKLYAQIKNGAPFDLFFAADARRPKLLEKSGTGVAGTRFTYAQGRLVLWSAKPGLVDDKGAVLKQGGFARIAIANPKTAPYGAAAKQVMEKMGVWKQLEPKVVRGENIAQTFQFTVTANAPLGFIALSQLKSLGAKNHGSQWSIPANLYTPIEQQAILLKRGEDNATARAFLKYMKGPEAAKIIAKFGYGAGH